MYEYYVIIIFKIVGDIFEVVEVSNLKSGGMIVVLSFCLKVIILIYDKKFNFDKKNIGVVKYKKLYKKDEIVKCVKEF